MPDGAWCDREAAGRNGDNPDPEVTNKAIRRRFSAAYKRRVVREADRCTKPGELGALLRREGLYSSSLRTWRRQHDAGELAGMGSAKRGRKAQALMAALSESARHVVLTLCCRRARWSTCLHVAPVHLQCDH